MALCRAARHVLLRPVMDDGADRRRAMPAHPSGRRSRGFPRPTCGNQGRYSREQGWRNGCFAVGGWLLPRKGAQTRVTQSLHRCSIWDRLWQGTLPVPCSPTMGRMSSRWSHRAKEMRCAPSASPTPPAPPCGGDPMCAGGVGGSGAVCCGLKFGCSMHCGSVDKPLDTLPFWLPPVTPVPPHPILLVLDLAPIAFPLGPRRVATGVASRWTYTAQLGREW